MTEVTVDVKPQLVPVELQEGPVSVSVVEVSSLDSFSVSVDPGLIPVVVEELPEVVPVTVSEGLPGATGPAGSVGPAGPEGPPGPSGEGGDLHLRFEQSSASAEWEIEHDLDKFPSVLTLDTAGEEVEGIVSWPSNEKVVVKFSAPFSGVAYLN